MRETSLSKSSASRTVRCAVAFTVLALAAACAGAQTYTLNVLSQFPSGTEPVGSFPLIRDAAGNLYGMTNNGSGAYGYGSVYELVSNHGSYSQTTLYSFTGGSDGENPNAGLSMDSAGNLYGTTNSGGANSKGTVFELQSVNGTFNFVLLHTFVGPPNDGGFPQGSLTIDSAGNLYGTTSSGGNNGGPGTVFELANNGAGVFSYSLLHSFTGTDGANPAGVVIGPGNLLYGICKSGGPGFVQGVGGSGLGTVYLLPEGQPATNPVIDIYLFAGGSIGTNPIGPPTVDAQGNVYVATSGTNSSGTTISGGSIIELVNSSNGYVEKTLYSFPLPTNNPGGDASQPDTSLVMDAYGNIFGATGSGGAYGEESAPPGGYGTIFELVNNAGSYQESVLYSAAGNGNGIRPGDLLMDQSGNFYGTFGHTSFTVGVGGQGNAEVWELAVQPATTSLALTASPNPAFYGDDVTLTAAVTANPQTAILPGTVTFSEGSLVLGTGLSTNGTVSITVVSNQLGAGADTITAQYSPSLLGLTASSGSVVETVNADSDIAVINGSNTFNGNQTVSGSVSAASFIGGTFTGNGAGLTNITATNYSGTILDSQVTGLSVDLTNAEAMAAAQAEASLSAAFVPLAGGAMTGALSTPSLSVTGAVASGSLTIGGGSAITQYVSTTAAITLPAVQANKCATLQTSPITGFTPGTIDTIALGIPGALISVAGGPTPPTPPAPPGPPGPPAPPAPPPPPPGPPPILLTYQAWETNTTASPTVTIEVCNMGGPAYPGGASGTIRIDIFKH